MRPVCVTLIAWLAALRASVVRQQQDDTNKAKADADAADAAAHDASKRKANEATAADVEKLAQRGVRGGDAANNAGSKAVEPKSAIDLEREKVCILYFFFVFCFCFDF